MGRRIVKTPQYYSLNYTKRWQPRQQFPAGRRNSGKVCTRKTPLFFKILKSQAFIINTSAHDKN
jgi:hypothetical protein